MRIRLNGEQIDTTTKDLAALIEDRGFDVSVVATALNGEFVPRALRAETKLAEGDAVEVLRPMQGG
ncbi:sulfur carrier protein ThiS [Polyangium jinanense]|uniref:Sulfur carrier protein ThiS n=1 Tax=Polyangium jinanense TaxID=2829994 RepID=A0A9X3XIS5_9BACT|nr:sulfur carrier protein ThiS [Polyangium jinanense]MDC3958689.1 sulfur carrier protein ThiS [Polyangium jinanense]MDC3989463.1 sulfur carrier protein ThiS [Polyangium jinanense]MDC3989564.1 sulfur carrier protein ThiS [Polyangium jinanense]